MASAAGQPQTLSCNSILAQDKVTPVLSPVSLGSYRVIKSRSRPMLSECGRFVSSPASPSSPLLQIASDINNSLLLTRDGSFRGRSNSNTLYISTEDTNNSISTKKKTPRLHSFSFTSSKSPDILNKNSDSYRVQNKAPNITALHSSVSLLSENPRPESQQSATFLQGMSARMADKKLTNFDISLSNSKNETQFSYRDQIDEASKKISESDIMQEKNIVKPHSTAARTSQMSNAENDTNRFNQSKVQKLHLLNEGEKLQSVSETGQSFSISKPKSFSMREDKTSLQKMESDKKDKSSNDKSKLSSFDEDKLMKHEPQVLENQENSTYPLVPAQRTKNTFLTELYSGAEKIKKFINRGKARKDKNSKSSEFRESQTRTLNDKQHGTSEAYNSSGTDSHKTDSHKTDSHKTDSHSESMTRISDSSLNAELFQSKNEYFNKRYVIDNNVVRNYASNITDEISSGRAESQKSSSTDVFKGQENNPDHISSEDSDNDVFLPPVQADRKALRHHSISDYHIPKLMLENMSYPEGVSQKSTNWQNIDQVPTRRRYSLSFVPSHNIYAGFDTGDDTYRDSTTRQLIHTNNDNQLQQSSSYDQLCELPLQSSLKMNQDFTYETSKDNLSSKVREQSRERLDNLSTRVYTSSNDAFISNKPVLTAYDKSYNYIETCRSEAELLDMLNTCNDLNERKRLRARIIELNTVRQRMGRTDTGSSTTLESDATRRLVDRTPMLSVAGSTSITSSQSSIAGRSITYETIQNVAELQKLLSETPNPAERNKIRNAIRKLRQRTESDELKNQRTAQNEAAPARAQLQRSNTVGSVLVTGQSPSLTTDNILRTSSYQNKSAAESQHSKTDTAEQRPSLPAVNFDNISNNDISGKSVESKSINVFTTDTWKQHFSLSSETLVPNYYQTVSSDYQSKNTPSNNSILSKTFNTQTLSSDHDDVSSVLQQVKERLKTTSESLPSEIKNISFPNSSYETLPQQNLGPALEAEQGVVFNFIKDNPDIAFSSATDRSSKGSLDKFSESPSAKYRETRKEILKSASSNSNSEDIKDTYIVHSSLLQSLQSDSRQLPQGTNIKLSTQLRSTNVDTTEDEEDGSDIKYKIPPRKQNPSTLRIETQKDNTIPLLQTDDSESRYRFLREGKTEQLQSYSSKETDTTNKLSILTDSGVKICKPGVRKEVTDISNTSSDKLSSQDVTSRKYELPNEIAPDPIKRNNDSSKLSDFQRLELGQKPSKSRTLVSSLAAKFSQFDQGDLASSSKLRRTQSLHSKVGNVLPVDRREIKNVLPETFIGSSSLDKRNINDNIHSNISKYQDTGLVRNTQQNVQPHEPGKSESITLIVNILKEVTSVSEINKPVSRSELINFKQIQQTNAATVGLTTKPALKKSKPLIHSWSESHINRPKPYTSDLKEQKLPTYKNKTESNDELTSESREEISRENTDSSLVNVGETLENCNKCTDNFKPDDSMINSNIQLFYVELKSPESKLNADLSESISTETSSIVTKGYTVTDDDHKNVHQQLTDFTTSSLHQTLHSTQPTQQPTPTMERAFSLLLEELDRISSSEGNPSDIDLSDGEDVICGSNISNKILGSSSPQHRPAVDVHVSSVNTHGILSSNDCNSTAVQFEKRNQVPKTNSSHDKLKAEYVTSFTKDLSIPNNKTHDSSGVELCKEDHLVSASTKSNFQALQQLSSLSSPSSSSLSDLPQLYFHLKADDRVRTQIKSDGTRRTLQTEMTGQQSKHITMETDAIDGHISDNNSIPTYTSANTLKQMNEFAESSTNFVPTRMFNVNEDDDGTITMQAVAEDHNQNQIVTVRTKKQRTPSNANEELRDTIVEKKKLSPQGTLLVEKDVITTKKRLTSRGSNYYTRSTLTTRTRREKGGSETVEHSVCVETDNKSVSQGHSWGDKAEAQITLEDENFAVSQPSISSSIASDAVKDISSDDEHIQIREQDTLYTKNEFIPNSLSSKNGHDNNETLHRTKEYRNLPQIIQQLKNIAVAEGTQIVLECCIISTEIPSIQWLKDNVELSDSKSHVFHFDASTGKASMMIQDATIFDTALYCCVCRNKAGEAMSECRVIVRRQPQNVPVFDKGLSDLTVTEGHSSILFCIVSGASAIDWYKNDVLQKNSSDFKQTFDGHECRLEIGEISLDDVGEYACVAKNEAGSQKTSCFLTVNECDQEIIVVPMFLTKLSNRVLHDGDTLMLECDVIGSPEPSISWLKDGKALLGKSLNISSSYDGRVASLQVSSMRIEDAGCYKCVAENPAGKVSMDANITVKVKNTEPHFASRLEDISTVSGRNVVLQCQITGSPQPTVLWRKNGSLVPTSHNCIQSYNNGIARLEILEACIQDCARYECIARNIVSEISCQCKVVVTESKVQAEEATAPKTEQIVTTLPKVTRHRVFHKLSEPRPADIISAVLQRASSHDLQRAQSFSHISSNVTRENIRLATTKVDTSNNSRLPSTSLTALHQPETLSLTRDSITVASRPGSGLKNSELSTTKEDTSDSSHLPESLVTVLRQPDTLILTRNITAVASRPGSELKSSELSTTKEDTSDSSHLPESLVTVLRQPETLILTRNSAAIASRPGSELKSSELSTTKEDTDNSRLPRSPLTSLRQPDALILTRNITAVASRSESGLKNLELNTTKENATSSSHLPASLLTALHQPETLSLTRDSITVAPRSSSVVKNSELGTTFIHTDTYSTHEPEKQRNVLISRTASMKLPETNPTPLSNLPRITHLSRSMSINVARSNTSLPSKSEFTFSDDNKIVSNRDQIVPKKTITSSSQELSTDLQPSSPIQGYMLVSPKVITHNEKEKITFTTLIKNMNIDSIDNSESFIDKHALDLSSRNDKETYPSSQIISPPSQSSESWSTSKEKDTLGISTVLSQSSHSSASNELTSIEKHQQASFTKPQAPSVSSLRQQFLKNDQMVTARVQIKPSGSSVGSVKRWHSLPPQETKPTVFQRKSVLNTIKLPIMPSYQDITNEEELHKMMNETEDFEERKKIRARIREIRDKQRDEMDAKRKQREAEAEDQVKKKFERAEEEKRKKMEAYKQQAPTHARESKYHEVSQGLIQDKFKAAEEEKAQKLAAYSSIAATKTGPSGGEVTTTTTSSTTSEKTPGGGTRTVTQKTTETKGFGGTSYGKPAEVTAQELTAKLMRSSGPGVIGHITVKTEAWNSTDGLVEKSEKSHSWGAKPQGPKSAMAAFKQMDNTANPNAAAAKSNGLITVSLAKRAASNMKRNVVAIKQEILNFCQQNVAEYEEVEVTNFSTSWNNGMAFCALIHHFFPNAFDFSKLDPKQRRYNFTLAFDTAEKEADIAPLLDVDDMVKMKNPDWKCVFTYVQSIYRHLKDHENNKAGPIEQ